MNYLTIRKSLCLLVVSVFSPQKKNPTSNPGVFTPFFCFFLIRFEDFIHYKFYWFFSYISFKAKFKIQAKTKIVFEVC